MDARGPDGTDPRYLRRLIGGGPRDIDDRGEAAGTERALEDVTDIGEPREIGQRSDGGYELLVPHDPPEMESVGSALAAYWPSVTEDGEWMVLRRECPRCLLAIRDGGR